MIESLENTVKYKEEAKNHPPVSLHGNSHYCLFKIKSVCYDFLLNLTEEKVRPK